MTDQHTIRRASGVAAIPAWIGTATLAIAIVLASRRTAVRLFGIEVLAASSATCLTMLHVVMRYKKPDGDDIIAVLNMGRDLGRANAQRDSESPQVPPGSDEADATQPRLHL